MPPTMLPDVSGMAAVSRDIRARADDVRRQRASLAARCRSVRWHSPAAVVFRDRAVAMLARLEACAHALDEAAATLDRHARTVHERVAELEAVPAAIGHAGAGIVHGVANSVESGVSRAMHWLGV